MSWLNKQVSLYDSHRDITGRVSTFKEVFFEASFESLPIIREIKQLYPATEGYSKKKVELKSKLKCFTPAAFLKSREKGNVIEISRTGIMQLDFDHTDIQDYDVEELKQCVFALPFIGWCELSCSGTGFYALALIAEPERLKDYADHCFNVLLSYGIKPDTTKGRNVNDLRYISYDPNPLIRENPEPLSVSSFKRKGQANNNFEYTYPKPHIGANSGLIKKLISELSQAQVGQRWAIVQRVAFTLGGKFDNSALQEIKSTIMYNSAFAGEEEKYIKCAEVCFRDGSNKPLN